MMLILFELPAAEATEEKFGNPSPGIEFCCRSRSNRWHTAATGK